MSFVTLVQHTHPRIPWFANKDEWSFYKSQVESTAHIKLPLLLRLLFHNILEHTAHHVDPKVPMYNLKSAQKAIESEFARDVHAYDF